MVRGFFVFSVLHGRRFGYRPPPPRQKRWKINTERPQVYEKVQYLDKIGLYLQFCQYIIKTYA